MRAKVILWAIALILLATSIVPWVLDKAENGTTSLSGVGIIMAVFVMVIAFFLDGDY